VGTRFADTKRVTTDLAIRWLLATAAATFAAIPLAMNFWIAGSYLLRPRRSSSIIPLLGGLFGGIAIGLCPACDAWHWWTAWIPAALDPGTIPSMLAALVMLAFRKGR